MGWIDSITRYLGKGVEREADEATHERMAKYNLLKSCERVAIRLTKLQASGGSGESPPLRRSREYEFERGGKPQVRTFILCTGYTGEDFGFAQGMRGAHRGETYEDGRAKGPCQFLLLNESGEPARVLVKDPDGVEREYPLCKFRTPAEARVARKVPGYGK